ncbi:hypothetical protein M378DRAFT_16546 [Amanita muscaria Koide BX008]|uniref:Uncharacterized protein n=1 Tax=Amanita muscaria (strain Koide BX008) TaxID=946122 RepID=A0A0C2WK38_AMAMK|nr:hypothetical protein M378DRAFT_16546 [Amanita muscaria Koide BX008]
MVQLRLPLPESQSLPCPDLMPTASHPTSPRPPYARIKLRLHILNPSAPYNRKEWMPEALRIGDGARKTNVYLKPSVLQLLDYLASYANGQTCAGSMQAGHGWQYDYGAECKAKAEEWCDAYVQGSHHRPYPNEPNDDDSDVENEDGGSNNDVDNEYDSDNDYASATRTV